MKLIIAGSRHFDGTYETLKMLLKFHNLSPTSILSGGATGVDTAAELLADDLNLPFVKFVADWTKYGRAAGPIRNKLMAQSGDALLLVWDGVSPGSKNMLQEALKRHLPVYEVVISPPYTTDKDNLRKRLS